MQMKAANDELSLIDFLSTALTGMKATGIAAGKSAVTENYPEERPVLPWGTKAQLHVDIPECIACFKCATACPSDCIRIDVVRAPAGSLPDTSDGHKRVFDVVRFDIDMGQCCYCGFCTGRSSLVSADKKDDPVALELATRSAACPTDCINFYERYENGTERAGNLMYHFAGYDFDQAQEMWNAAAPNMRRTTHPGKPESDYQNGSKSPPNPRHA
jgi:formate hydrogenlyase subunit 6/NADH:ubiquinone oxidoreductase subunit I